ncbi:MAG: ribosomal-processing cysteine protease Prp [Peptococcaceae bacterium]|nr:ribosomal-processing cysteine protease Prp [Peptococcaceae bacterium]
MQVFHQPDGVLCGYDMRGHADSAPHGEDLVCAAASTLAIVIENSLCVQGVAIEGEMDEGYVKVMLKMPDPAQEDPVAQAVLKTFEVGANALAQTYPRYIKVDSVLI